MLHLVIPGLLLAPATLADAIAELPLPALSSLLGRGRITWQPAQPLEHWLAQAFGMSTDPVAYGALRLLGEGVDPADAIWVCADPVPLQLTHDKLIVGSPAELDLDAAEAAQFIATLNTHFSDVGEFVAPHPARWYLRLSAQTAAELLPARLHPLSSVVSRSMRPFLPTPPWQRLMNEIQMALHHHPQNAAREAAGKPRVGGVWLWGAGKLPTARIAPTTPIAPITALWTNGALARGLAMRANIPHQPLPVKATPADGMAVLDTLAEAAQALNVPAWIDAIVLLESEWFAPLLAALKSRRLSALRITALGDAGIADIHFEARDTWKFWRGPKTLATLQP